MRCKHKLIKAGEHCTIRLMEMVMNVKEVFSDSMEAMNWVKENFKSTSERKQAMMTILKNKEAIGVYCYG